MTVKATRPALRVNVLTDGPSNLPSVIRPPSIVRLTFKLSGVLFLRVRSNAMLGQWRYERR